MKRIIRVAITQGDHNGVGPEVVLKALANSTMLELCTPIVFADKAVMEAAAKLPNVEAPVLNPVASAAEARDGKVNIVDLKLANHTVEAGKPTQTSGEGAVASLDAALTAVMNGEADVLVTSPISKEAAQSDKFRYAGHTEYLGDKTGGTPQMILFDENLKVALVTTHLPVSQIAQAITQEKVEKAVETLSNTLKQDFGVERPTIAVLALNPHSGDGGLLGEEEKDVIIPAIKNCMQRGLMAFGPYPADGFFGTGAYRNFDAVLAMYHDQGLAPFKTLACDRGVNFTAGLPVVRTSPDHGTGYDIAWQGTADAASMREAIYKAIDIKRNRDRHADITANPLPKQEKSAKPAKRERPEKAEPAETEAKEEKGGEE